MLPKKTAFRAFATALSDGKRLWLAKFVVTFARRLVAVV